jgi:hypothetical protein
MNDPYLHRHCSIKIDFRYVNNYSFKKIRKNGAAKQNHYLSKINNLAASENQSESISTVIRQILIKLFVPGHFAMTTIPINLYWIFFC